MPYLSPSLEPAGARADHGGAGSCLLGANPRAGCSCNRAAGGEGEEELHGPAAAPAPRELPGVLHRGS